MRTEAWKHWIGVASFAWTKLYPSSRRTWAYGRITLILWRRAREGTQQKMFFPAGSFELRKHLFARHSICDFSHLAKIRLTIYKPRCSRKNGGASAMFPVPGTRGFLQNHSS